MKLVKATPIGLHFRENQKFITLKSLKDRLSPDLRRENSESTRMKRIRSYPPHCLTKDRVSRKSRK